MNATRHEDATATAIIGQKVLPGLEKEYEPWQENVNAAADDYPGALGSEISPPPSVTKTAIALWVGLYPTVVLLALATSPLKLPIWSGLLLGNLLSSLAMSFFTMPFYVNPLLKRWLRPDPHQSARKTNLIGLGIVAVANLFWILVFYLVTKVIWTLPRPDAAVAPRRPTAPRW
ncbi:MULTISPECIES: hypothetical protein [unclassified Streptomyces]|uniref:hypothetical protein n=1 Tax=unclassified Streptomyces TaxID=2593676 RepID=UPI002E322B42|nr:hypothetical protein [Streptomyces sp. NBC_01278]